MRSIVTASLIAVTLTAGLVGISACATPASAPERPATVTSSSITQAELDAQPSAAEREVTARTAAPVATVSVPAPSIPAVPTFTDGTYVVGEDMPAGTYSTSGNYGATDQCYWATHRNDAGTAGTIIKNHIGAGTSRFRAVNGQVVELSLGCSWMMKR